MTIGIVGTRRWILCHSEIEVQHVRYLTSGGQSKSKAGWLQSSRGVRAVPWHEDEGSFVGANLGTQRSKADVDAIIPLLEDNFSDAACWRVLDQVVQQGLDYSADRLGSILDRRETSTLKRQIEVLLFCLPSVDPVVLCYHFMQLKLAFTPKCPIWFV